MRAILTAVFAGVLMAGCAGMEPAGRNATRNAPAPTPVASAPARTTAPAQVASAPMPAPQPQRRAAITPPPQSVAPPPQTAPAPTVVASAQEAAPAEPRRGIRTRPDDVVVPGQVQRQVRPPQGDPRTTSERMEDIRAWDRCVIEVQGAALDSDPMEPQLDTPEDVCRNQLGMADRLSVPYTTRRPR